MSSLRRMGHGHRQGGFTLVEMSIVLVIIGLIVSAVSIGMNLHRSAEYQRIKQKFIDGWVIAYNEYYNRTGTVVGDDPIQPTYMVAGVEYNFEYDANDTGLPDANLPGDGAIDATTSLYLLCEGDGAPFYGLEGQAGTLTRSALSLHTLMDNAGIRMPAGRAEGQEDRYVYLDSNGNPQELQVCFLWSPANTWHGSGNAMVIRGLTPDLARQLDRMIDGKADAQEGRFRQFNLVAHTETDEGDPGDPGDDIEGDSSQVPGQEWTGINSIDVTAGDSLADLDPEAFNTGALFRDEHQVMRVTAVYLMDF